MGRRKVDRSDRVMQTFESTQHLKKRLNDLATERQITVSALIRNILCEYFENRQI